MSTISVSTMASIRTEVDVDVDVDIDDVIEAMTPEHVRKVLAKLPPSAGGVGDPTAERYVSAAFERARQMSDCPREFTDLLWFVHQLAVA